MMKSKYVFGCALFLACSVMAVGQETKDKQHLAYQSLEHVMPIKNFGAEVYDNPALQSFRYKTSLNTLSVGYDYRHATSPKSLEQGDGHGRAFANIDAYLHKGKATLGVRLTTAMALCAMYVTMRHPTI